jgi:hypothetical protein
MKKITTTAFTFLLGIGMVAAQESPVATGGDASGAGGSSSYSVGQIVYTTNAGSNGSVAQGVQQPYEISVTTGIDVKTIQLEMLVYPNPTTDYLTLKIENIEVSTLNFQLYDVQGKIIENNQILDNTTTIKMLQQSKGIYFLKVANNNVVIKTFKIIKN